jgi:hypothetical protein
MLLTLPMSGYLFQEAYLEYIALSLMFVGFDMGYMKLVSGCHNGKWGCCKILLGLVVQF